MEQQRFDSLVKSDQKTLKVGIHSFIALRSALKSLCEDKSVSSLVVFLGKALNEIASTFREVRLVVICGSFTRRPKRSLRCVLVEVP